MDNLRIALLSLHTCPWSRPGDRYTGGMNVYIRNLCLEMKKRGITTDVYTRCHKDKESCNFNSAACRAGLIHISDCRTWPCQEARAFSLAQIIDSYRLERSIRYDIIHSHYWLSGLVGSYLKDIWRVPHITMFHTLGELKNGSLPTSREPDHRMASERSVIHSCDRIISSTYIEKREIIRRYGIDAGKISVIPCGVNPALFHPSPGPVARAACGLPEKKTLLFVGRPDPIKGLNNLLQAISLLDTEIDLQLVITGCGNHTICSSVPTSAGGSRRPTNRVIFTGPIDHEKMPLYYNAADLCIIPSFYESFCITALESLYCGTPVIATRVGEIPELSLLTSLCKIIPDNRPETLATYIRLHLETSTPEIPHAAPVLSTKYCWDSIADRMIHEYRRTLSLPEEAVSTAPSYQ